LLHQKVHEGQSLESQDDAAPTNTAADELRRERDFTSAILDTIWALVVVLDRSARIVRFNRACERMTGYSFDEVKGREIWPLLIAPHEVPVVRRVFDELLGGRFPNEFENDWVTRDGARRRIAWSNTAICGSTGAVEYVIGTGIDITEKRALEALRWNEHGFRTAVDHLPVVFFIYDADRRFRFVNAAGIRASGLSEQQLIGRTDEEVFPPEVTRGYLRALKETVETRTPRTIENTVTLGPGTITVIVTFVPLLNDRGELQQILGIGHDITARRQAEEAKRTAEQRLEVAVGAAHIGIYDHDLKTGRVVWSEQLARLFGLTLDQFGNTFESFLKRVHPDDRAAIIDKLNCGLNGGDRLVHEYRAIRRDGAVRWFEARGRLFHGDSDRSVGTVTDITERKIAQEQLLNHREQLRSLASQLTLTEERERRRIAMAARWHRPEPGPGLPQVRQGPRVACRRSSRRGRGAGEETDRRGAFLGSIAHL
jgi:PAS domain S-box-containing protein